MSGLVSDIDAPRGMRRRTLLLAASALAGCGGLPQGGTPVQARTAASRTATQGPGTTVDIGAPPGNAVLPVAMPCADKPGDITGLVFEGAGSPAHTVAVFGQAFRPGDLPRGGRLTARMADTGRQMRTQADVTTHHPDGSARFAVVSVELPAALPAGDRLGFVLAAQPGAAAEPALDPRAALSGRQAVVEVTPAGGGAPWRFDLLGAVPSGSGAAPRDGLGGGGKPWQWGPLAAQWRVAAQVPASAVGGATSMRLVADIGVRADGTLWVDAWFRNDIAQRQGGGAARYSARVLLDGAEALAFAPPGEHFQYTGFGRQLVARAGGKPAPGHPILRPNAAYLAETGAVAPYDTSIGVDPGILQRMQALRAGAEWNRPFDPRGISRAMPAGGGRPDIGPMTDWQAAWLITGEPLAATVAIGQAEAAGAIPWHIWDVEGGADRRGGWLNVQRWPGFWTDPRGGPPPGGLMQQTADTGWQVDVAHQPDVAFFPYLMTGRRALLDELSAQGMYNMIGIWPAVRNPPDWAGKPGHDMIVGWRQQMRGAAWSLRQIDEIGWIVPDDDPDAALYHEAQSANWAWLRAQIPNWTREQGEAHGWLPGEYGTAGALPPWQQDYLASSVAAAARRGNADARAFLTWMTNFLVGRFRAENRGFPFNDGAAYLISIAPNSAPHLPPYRTWAEVGARMREIGWSNGAGWEHSVGDYVTLALQSLAQVIDVLDTPEAREAYFRLLAARAPYGRPDTLARQPNQNIAPRGMPRFPSRLRACTAAAPLRG